MFIAQIQGEQYQPSEISEKRNSLPVTQNMTNLGRMYVMNYFTEKRYNNHLPAVQFYGVNFVLFVEMSKHSK